MENTKAVKGMKVFVLKGEHDCTLNGISSKHDHLIIVGEGIPERYEGNEDGSNVVKLVKRFIGGRDYFHAEPINKPKNTVGAMFGGNYLNATGSMIANLDYPISIHDRFETQEMYNTLST